MEISTITFHRYCSAEQSEAGTRVRVGEVSGALNLRFRDSHAYTPVPKRGTLHSSFATYGGQKKHFSETRRDERYDNVNDTTNVILRIGSDGPFVFIHDAFSLSPTHPR